MKNKRNTRSMIDEQERLFRLFNEIGIVNQLSSARFERTLPHELSLAQFSVLNNFARLGGTRSPSQLAAAFQVTKGAMTHTLAKLRQKGFVSIITDPQDARAKVVSITRSGRRARERAIQAAQDSFADVGDVLDGEDVERLLAVLEKLRGHLDRHR